MAGSIIAVKWSLDVVDKGGPAKLLKADRELRRNLSLTDRTYGNLAKTVTGAGTKMVQSSQRVSRGHGMEQRAVRGLSSDVRNLSRSRDGEVAAGRRIVAASSRIEGAYRREARAAKEASAAAKTRVTAAQAAERAGKGTVAAAAVGGRALRGGAAALGVAGAGVAVGGAIKIFASFEQQMDKVAAVSGASRHELKLLENQAKSLGQSTSFSNREVAAAMDELARSGFTVKEVMKAIPGTLSLAAASGTDLAESAAIQASQLRAFELPASRAGHVADVLAKAVNRSAIDMTELGDTMKYVAPVAGRFNQSFEDMAASAAILGNVGIKGSQAGTTLRRAFVSVVKPSIRTMNVLDDAGISAKRFAKITQDSQGNLRPFPQMLGRLSGALQGVDKATRRRTIAQLFGTEALPGMITLIDKGQGSIERMSDSLRKSDGYAKKTAHTMRDNVAGAFDQFTGSVETAATNLVERFGPALRKGLLGAAAGVTVATKQVTDFVGGLAGDRAAPRARTVARGAARTEGIGRSRSDAADSVRDATGAQKVGAQIRKTIEEIIPVAARAGKQLLDAFRPAMPFFQNVLLPLLKGIGKGILISLVGAFKVLVPMIKIVATVLGAIGKVAKPLKPVFEGIGVAIGFLATGPILKVISGLGKLGGIFRIIAGAAKVLRIPIEAAGAAFGVLGRGIAGGLRWMARVNPAVVAVRAMIAKVPGVIGSVAGKATAAARAVAKGIVKGIDFVKAAPGRVVNAIGGIAGKIANLNTKLAASFFRLGHGMVSAIVRGVRSAIGGVATAFAALKPSFDIDLNPIGGVHFHMSIGGKQLFRKGGRARRYQGGGLVPALVSSGEEIIHGNSSFTVPGPPTAADNVFAMLPDRSAVLTYDGQARMGAGMSLAGALASQAPHFQSGGLVGTRVNGRVSTFGPPTEKKGTTALGVSSGNQGVAIRPGATYQTGRPFLGGYWRITIGGHTAILRQTDIGPNQSTGRRIDVTGAGSIKLGINPKQFPTDSAGVATFLGTHASTAALKRKRGTTGGGDSTKKVPITLGRSPARGGLIDDAFTTALENKRAGTSPGRAAFLGSVREALRAVQTTRDVTIKGKTKGAPSKASAGAGGYNTSGSGTTQMDGKPVATWIARILKKARADRVAFRVASGVRSRAAQQALWDGAPGNGLVRGKTVAAPGTSNHEGVTYPRGAVDISDPQSPFRGWLAKHPKAPLKWYGPGDRFHFSATGHRRGGIIGRYRKGLQPSWAKRSNLSSATSSLAASKAGSLDKFADIVNDAASSALEALRKKLLAQVQKGGSAKVIARLQAGISIIDNALGERIGTILRQVDLTKTTLDRWQGGLERILRVQGTDPSSAAGLQAQSAFTQAVVIPGLQSNVSRLASAAAAARRAGQPVQARAIEEELAQAQDDLAEAITSQIERWRDVVRAMAQETVDRAQFSVDYTQGSLAGLDVNQRLNRTADTPEGMRQRAAAIQSQLIPALQASMGALQNQAVQLASIGDVAGWRQAVLAVQQAGTDIGTAMADAADLIRDAALQAAQNVVDTAASGTSLAQLGLAHLELEQRIAGTYDAGGQQRADFIRQTIMPALEAELTALQAQQQAANTQGDEVLARQIAEAIAGKQNEILQATLDATEQVADNTDPSKRVGGTLGFAFGDETLTDAIIGVGNGS